MVVANSAAGVSKATYQAIHRLENYPPTESESMTEIPDELPEITPGVRHPGFMAKVAGFVVSFADWYAMGMPWRTPDETQELFDTHCRGRGSRIVNGLGVIELKETPCPEYDPEARAFIGWPKGVCLACSCHVSGDAYEILNKVNKPHMGCPLEKWKKVIDHGDIVHKARND